MPTQRERAERIRNKARELFARPDVGNCESLAQLVEWALQEFASDYIGTFNNDEESFVEDFGLVLTDVDECGAARSKDLDLYAGFGFATDTCFQEMFRDGSNQVRHFWGYVIAGFQYGQLVGQIATVRDLGEEADIQLGQEGADLGAGLDGLGVGLDQVADWIRSNLCKKGDCFAPATGAENEEDEDEEDEEEEEEEEEGDDDRSGRAGSLPRSGGSKVSGPRSAGYRVRRLLGTVAIFSGAAWIWAGLERLNARIVRQQMRRYAKELRARGDILPPGPFRPLAYFQSILTHGLTAEEANARIYGARRRRRMTDGIAFGRFALVYEFRFGFMPRRRWLIAIFDEKSVLTDVTAIGLKRS